MIPACRQAGFKGRLAVRSLPEKRKMISKGHPKLSVVKQSQLLGLHRSGIYYKPRGESDLNLELMNEHYLHHPLKEPNGCMCGYAKTGAIRSIING